MDPSDLTFIISAVNDTANITAVVVATITITITTTATETATATAGATGSTSPLQPRMRQFDTGQFASIRTSTPAPLMPSKIRAILESPVAESVAPAEDLSAGANMGDDARSESPDLATHWDDLTDHETDSESNFEPAPKEAEKPKPQASNPQKGRPVVPYEDIAGTEYDPEDATAGYCRSSAHTKLLTSTSITSNRHLQNQLLFAYEPTH
ncbi:uncharacterized protein B0T15DRAFT_491479 [Chaetomium strumarium]|uniref:Uncharacterized protein n=1 Tax=Chaetomium strumarium TaxID=1170767 RepID=A0AAJ0GZB8_9PEZI|nr:hypothetical protein B0T15DRAFT_491479 [Chaetomium strumarium]